jgi:hypothetical protein
VTELRRALGIRIPEHRQLTHEELQAIGSRLGTGPTFTFPLVRRTVTLRWMVTYPPYVGVDYGAGRNVVFDLKSMRHIYAD